MRLCFPAECTEEASEEGVSWVADVMPETGVIGCVEGVAGVVGALDESRSAGCLPSNPLPSVGLVEAGVST